MSVSSIRSFTAHKDVLRCSLQRETCGEAMDAPTWWQNIIGLRTTSVFCVLWMGNTTTLIYTNIMLEILVKVSQLLSHNHKPIINIDVT